MGDQSALESVITIAWNTQAWFDMKKPFGFLALAGGQGVAFLQMSTLHKAGYVWTPRGNTMRATVETDRCKWRRDQAELGLLLERVFYAADGILDLTLGLIRLAFTLELGVARQIAGGLFDLAPVRVAEPLMRFLSITLS